MRKKLLTTRQIAIVGLLCIAITIGVFCFSTALRGFLERNETAIEACATLFVAIFTFTLWIATQRLGELALEQGEAMDKSIAEAARATEATASIAKATTDNAALMQGILHKQMRAYISVEAGLPLYQDENIRFQGKPVLTNTGFTPARNVSYHAMAAVLDTHLRDDYVFERFGNASGNDTTLSPRQSITINNAIVRERHPDNEVEGIMSGQARRLYVWGVVQYEDIFGGKWETNFCFNYTFFRDGKGDLLWSSFIFNRHNSAT